MFLVAGALPEWLYKSEQVLFVPVFSSPGGIRTPTTEKGFQFIITLTTTYV